MPVYSIDGVSPEFVDENSAWIAPDASVVGRVRIGGLLFAHSVGL